MDSEHEGRGIGFVVDDFVVGDGGGDGESGGGDHEEGC